VRLDLYDAAGRLVARLVDRDEEAGERSVVWDGRNAAGGQVAAGTYFARLSTPDGVRTTKLSLIK